MKGRWKYLLIVLIFCVVAVLLVMRAPGRKVRVTLTDGSEVILRELTFGTNHIYRIGGPLQKALERMAPARLKARLGVQRMMATSDAVRAGVPTLVAWTEYSGVGKAIDIRVCDEAGREQGPERADVSSAALGGKTRAWANLFSSFPRRSRFVTFRVYSRTKATNEFCGEFRVENPAYRKYPKWTPETLPIKRETNDLRFTLTRFETGVLGTNEFASIGPVWTEIEYEFGPPDFISGPWTPLEVVISDATGNRVRGYRPTQQYVISIRGPSKHRTIDSLRRGIVSVPAMLWLDEPAWRIHLELLRGPGSGFKSNELWEVNDVAVPRIGETNLLRQSIQRYGTNIVFESLAAYDAGNRPFANPILKLEMIYPTRSALRVFVQKVTDQRGQPVAGSDFYLHPLSEESKRLNFRFVIHSVVALDFVAKPQFTTNRVLNPENSLMDRAGSL